MDSYALQSYEYDLPSELIASYPASPRESARLLIYERASKKITHSSFKNLFKFIPPSTTIILNDTRVLKARIYGTRLGKITAQNPLSKNDKANNKSQNQSSGGKREILFHRFISKDEVLQEISQDKNLAEILSQSKVDFCSLCQTKGKLKNGDIIALEKGYEARVLATLPSGYKVIAFFYRQRQCAQYEIIKMLETIGHIPLPPYIKREDSSLDESEYQTVFATQNGSIAAPTASLHFSKSMLKELYLRFPTATLTLHIGAGTFAPVVSEDIRLHNMHKEWLSIPPKTQKAIKNASKILCVGSSSMRSVECYARALTKLKTTQKSQHLSSDFTNDFTSEVASDFQTQCDIFLHPQNPPIKTDFLLTNFHLPKSTLIMLVASMVGLDEWRKIYNEAIAQKYRFYSYGDAMLIL
ncbi:tRNA preQ1(34) S-adenosylmethionine ribosyltransferase-isomerase QueA [Helicobacter macacae]|uniref:S-adenosylmethionine:tRNA ribosyltransferase-isomerase n=1 Tax=Helicobacter macacae MIT 99-5501 TaxID=1357400 RepID=V8C984_9HELI|nr:tRNA preQ1(34) S-adenosylmethionine ribosyltransferase-isomerase QueA [Helicobacter macacae]ETD23565.1 S-adenosylmethionine:tRNA ribosyltransferase-isomerase [Helicobacter macacae MIT 99-5501]